MKLKNYNTIMIKLILQIIISLFFIYNSTILLLAQDRIIEGMVTTFDSIPLVGASIEIKS